MKLGVKMNFPFRLKKKFHKKKKLKKKMNH